MIPSRRKRASENVLPSGVAHDPPSLPSVRGLRLPRLILGSVETEPSAASVLLGRLFNYAACGIAPVCCISSSIAISTQCSAIFPSCSR